MPQVVVAEGRVSVKGSVSTLGSHVFILKRTPDAAKGLSWQAISPYKSAGAKISGVSGSEESVVSRLKADDAFQRAMNKSMGVLRLVRRGLPLRDRSDACYPIGANRR